MNEPYLGASIPKLGFGFMRLPKMQDGSMDMEQIRRMVDLYMQRGFTYFDTAYTYDGGASETALREALVERYPRSSFQVATKLSLMSLERAEDGPYMFETSLKRLGLDRIDFYLLHNISRERDAKADQYGVWDYVNTLKASGRISHLGISFHDTADVLDDVLTRHPEVEFVQLQINYADWENPRIQSRLCYETARRHNKPVIVMEPVKGGALARLSGEAEAVLKAADPDASAASWAIRFAASLDGLITVLSGMSTYEQLDENTSFMRDMKPLTDQERASVFSAAGALLKSAAIACTACRYCVEGCPANVNIPMIFDLYNDYLTYHQLARVKNTYALYTKKTSGKASACLRCGACEEICPQHLPIRTYLAEIAGVFDE